MPISFAVTEHTVCEESLSSLYLSIKYLCIFIRYLWFVFSWLNSPNSLSISSYFRWFNPLRVSVDCSLLLYLLYWASIFLLYWAAQKWILHYRYILLVQIRGEGSPLSTIFLMLLWAGVCGFFFCHKDTLLAQVQLIVHANYQVFFSAIHWSLDSPGAWTSAGFVISLWWTWWYCCYARNRYSKIPGESRLILQNTEFILSPKHFETS